MALQNIGAGNSDDAFYRYKMPRMITKVVGRGNGRKTNIVNMVDIAKALARPASYTTKYFGCELGAISKFDEKSGVSLVNGDHETPKLAGLLENFIKKYVQCYGCGNPETEIIITKTQMLQLKCAACGFISDVDMRDKLTSFILKNPPKKKVSKDKKAMRRAEKERLNQGEAADENNNSPAGSQADDEDDVQWQTDTSAEAARQRIQEQLSAVTAEMVMLSTTVENENGNKSEHVKLVEEIKSNLKKGAMTVAQMQSFLDSLNNGSTNEEQVMNALFEALFNGVEKGFAKEVGKKKKYLAAAVHQKEGSQMLLLKAIEDFCKKSKSSDVVKEVALVLKELYDSDILEEEFIVKWFEAGSNNKEQIWKNAKPFVEWLQNAEPESE